MIYQKEKLLIYMNLFLAIINNQLRTGTNKGNLTV